MAKVKNPITLAEHFEIDPDLLSRLKITNVTLAVDTRLFVDPFLLSICSNKVFAKDATEQYYARFEMAVKLLAATKVEGDVAWRNLTRLFAFKEVKGTCLGYGAASIDGSGWGPILISRVLKTGKEIVTLGIEDPDIFTALALFEEDIGPDRISDMTTTIILPALLDFNKRMLGELGLKGEPFPSFGNEVELLKNPFHSKPTPIILIPNDILRPLPIARDWDEISAAAAYNDALRKRVSEHIAHVWEIKTKRDKEALRSQALSSKEAFQTILDSIKAVPKKAYDIESDPEGYIKWAELGKQSAEHNPLSITRPQQLTLESAYDIVKIIVKQFRQLVEENGLAKFLWHGGKPLPEKFSQRLFFAVAYSYCHSNNLDISPEVDSGNGQVDFKFSSGLDCKILVEIKLSKSSNVVVGYTKQLEAYKVSEKTMKAFYLVIDVGKVGEKFTQLDLIKSAAIAEKKPLSDLEYVDAKPKPSASKRRN